MNKKITIIIGVILIVSIGANLFFFGRQWLRNERQRNFNAGIIWTFEQAKQLGQVSYTNQDGEQIILIIKP